MVLPHVLSDQFYAQIRVLNEARYTAQRLVDDYEQQIEFVGPVFKIALSKILFISILLRRSGADFRIRF